MTVTIKEEHIIERAGNLRKYVQYVGLLDAFHRETEGKPRGIDTEVIQAPTDQNGDTAVVRARVWAGVKGTDDYREFTGIGDATPQNVGRTIAPHKIRMAETRAKARALRDFLNISDYDVDEADSEDVRSAAEQPRGQQANGASRQAPKMSESLMDQIKAEAKAAGFANARELREAHHPEKALTELTPAEGAKLLNVLKAASDPASTEGVSRGVRS